MQYVPIRTYFAVAGFLHVKAGIEAARLALFFQPRPNLPAILGHQIEIAFTKSLHTQDIVHRQTFANFLLLIGPRRGIAAKVRHCRSHARTAAGYPDDHALFDPDLGKSLSGRTNKHAVGVGRGIFRRQLRSNRRRQQQ